MRLRGRRYQSMNEADKKIKVSLIFVKKNECVHNYSSHIQILLQELVEKGSKESCDLFNHLSLGYGRRCWGEEA